MEDESIFSQDEETPFPKNFKEVVSKILRRMYRVFVHVYIHHFVTIREINAEAHVNNLFRHFYFFSQEFHLIGDKDLEPLNDLIQKICI